MDINQVKYIKVSIEYQDKDGSKIGKSGLKITVDDGSIDLIPYLCKRAFDALHKSVQEKVDSRLGD